ncbi:hypothetical protein QVD17_14831 [Tagetes erecta]|uniref:Uncharacterized protein n=1 Tax=Tagetes erecta TaxID=13708 RepID=A0AAD8KTQ5_TARER|nr:hypothetical protein QVD17_14831 [Tagetes erecta]
MTRTNRSYASSYSSSTTTASNKPLSMQYTLGQNPPNISAADPRAKKSGTNDVGTTHAPSSTGIPSAIVEGRSRKVKKGAGGRKGGPKKKTVSTCAFSPFKKSILY